MKFCFRQKCSGGFSLFELVMTLAVLSVMILAAVPLMQNSIRREKEQKLREALRDMRNAIDEFKRDTNGACPTGNVASQNAPSRFTQQTSFDPRSRVMVDDCTIFGSENMDRYPPTLDALVEGVRVKSRAPNTAMGAGAGGSVFDQPNATEIGENKEVTKIYLRALPIDPMTGEPDWDIRSVYQDKDAADWDKVNVFDVRSRSKGEAMNGEKYNEW